MDRLPNIFTQVIPHSCQVYDTAGDYEEFHKHWVVRISELRNWKFEFLVLIHELVEMALTKANGVDWKDIDEFDKNGEGSQHPDPGMLPHAPYHHEHVKATYIEQKVAKMLGVDWDEYNRRLDSLEYRQKGEDSCQS